MAPYCEDSEQSVVPGWMIDEAAVSPHAQAEAIEGVRILRELVESLPEDKRRVVLMVNERDMDMAAVAKELGIPLGTAKSRLYYARRILAERWKEIAADWEDE